MPRSGSSRGRSRDPFSEEPRSGLFPSVWAVARDEHDLPRRDASVLTSISDIRALVRAQPTSLRNSARARAARTGDPVTRAHLEDIVARITEDPQSAELSQGAGCNDASSRLCVFAS